MPAKVLSSASILCYLNGNLFGQVASFSFRSINQRRSLRGIDSLDSFELTPGPNKINGVLRLYRLIGDGGAEGAGLTTNFENIPAEQYFSLELKDRSSNLTIFRANECSVLSQSWDMHTKSIVTGSVEFEALTWSNETES